MAEWQPIDFHGIVTLKKGVIQELKAFLEEKESRCAHLVAHTIAPVSADGHAPSFFLPTSPALALKDGVDMLRANVKGWSADTQQVKDENSWKAPTAQITRALWDFVEILEGAVTEFFQQLDRLGLEHGDSDLVEVVNTMKLMLQQKLQLVAACLGPIQSCLKEYRHRCQKSASLLVVVKNLMSPCLLDKEIHSNIIKTEKLLGFRYQTFMHRINQYEQLCRSTEQSLKKFDGYLIFNQFETRQKAVFLKLYRWLRLWELNQTTKAIPDREPILAIRSLQPPEKVVLFVRQYENALKAALFSKSRLLKQQPNSLIDLINKIQHQHALQGQIAELHTLANTVRRYRNFLLKTDPNPYIRSRLGFGEWIVGPEPAIAGHLMELIYDIEHLNELFKRLMSSIENGGLIKEQSDHIKERLAEILREMTQPLASYQLMKEKGELLTYELKRLDELGSTEQEVINFVGEVFSKGLRTDWKFHVLHEIKDFKELFLIHQGIAGGSHERSHLNRMRHFHKQIHKIQVWVKGNETFRHLDEIEVDISDLKGYLQDFLAHVQRLAKEARDRPSADTAALEDAACQLLEYRYLFGEFFHHLRRDKAEERALRNQFLFVDQYFETISMTLHEVLPTIV